MLTYDHPARMSVFVHAPQFSSYNHLGLIKVNWVFTFVNCYIQTRVPTWSVIIETSIDLHTSAAPVSSVCLNTCYLHRIRWTNPKAREDHTLEYPETMWNTMYVLIWKVLFSHHYCTYVHCVRFIRLTKLYNCAKIIFIFTNIFLMT